MSTPASTLTGSRAVVDRIIEAPRVQNAIIVLILVNAVVLGLETSASLMARHGTLLHAIDHAILAVFVIELALKFYARRLALLRDPWSVFDLIVVGIALVPSTGPFAVLRALRVLRVFRLLTKVPSMRRVVGGLLGAIPGLSSVFAVISVLFYVSAVIATNLFGQTFPEWFGTVGRSAYTLFQVMTLESWSMGIVRPVMVEYPYAWMFFVPFIMVATFTLLNLFIGVIVSAIQSQHDAERQAVEAQVVEHIDQEGALVIAEIRALRAEVERLRAAVEAGPSVRPSA